MTEEIAGRRWPITLRWLHSADTSGEGDGKGGSEA